jgi:PAS domain S-box-containing protein
MNILNIITGVLILIGSIVILFAIVNTGNILKLLKPGDFRKTWKVLKLFMFSFLTGFLVADSFVLYGMKNIPLVLSGTVFFLGSLFVSVVVRASYLTINRCKKAEKEIKELNDKLEKKISERTANLTEAVEKLGKSEEKYRKMVEVIGDVVYTTNYKGYFTYINPACEKLTGYKQNEIIGKRFTDLVAPEWRQRTEEFYLNQFKNKTDETLFSFPIITKSGEEKWIEQTVIRLDEGNKISGFRSIVRDITSRKIAEEKLKDNEEQLKTIINGAPEALIVMNDEGKITKWNPKAERMFGWKPDEILGKSASALFIPVKDSDKYLEIENFLKTGISSVQNKTREFTVINKDNIAFDVELTASKTILKDKNIFIVFLRDISSKKKQEKQIQESEQFLDSIIENIPSVIFVKEVKQLSYVRLNKAAEDLIGLERKELLGKTDLDLFPKEEAQFYVDNDKKALKKGGLIDIQKELINTKKGKRWLHTRIIPLKDQKGNSTFILGISEDITEKIKMEEQREQAEKLIRNNELRLRLILENIGEGVAVADKEKKIILANHLAEEIIGIKQGASTSNILNWLRNYELYYPDEKTIFPVQNFPLEMALKGEPTDDVEIVVKDLESQSKKRLMITGRPIKDQNDNVVAAVTTIRDITQYKKLENALEESEKKYRKLIGFATK